MGSSNLEFVPCGPKPREHVPEVGIRADLESLYRLGRTIESKVVRRLSNDGELEIDLESTTSERGSALDSFNRAYLRFTKKHKKYATRIVQVIDRDTNIPRLLVDGEPYDSARKYFF